MADIKSDEELTRRIADLVRWIRATYPNFNSRRPIDRLNSAAIDCMNEIEEGIYQYYQGDTE